VERLQRYGDVTVFSKWRLSAMLDILAAIGTTHDDHLMVSIIVQNLVKVDVVVSITWNFQYFARLA